MAFVLASENLQNPTMKYDETKTLTYKGYYSMLYPAGANLSVNGLRPTPWAPECRGRVDVVAKRTEW